MANEFVFDERKAKRIWAERPRKVRGVGRTMTAAYFGLMRAIDEGGSFQYYAATKAHADMFCHYVKKLVESNATSFLKMTFDSPMKSLEMHHRDSIFRFDIIGKRSDYVHSTIYVDVFNISKMFDPVRAGCQLLDDLGELADIAFCRHKDLVALMNGEPPQNSRIW